MSKEAICTVAAVAVASALLLPAGAAAQSYKPTSLLAATPTGDKPNAPATHPALSGDGRISRYAGFASAATDIAGPADGHRNVFVVPRARPWSLNGTAWREQPTVLVTRGLGGKPANGDSWGPSFDGYDYAPGGGREITVATKCVAFVSRASNLVPGDRNGRADVFVKRLPGGPLTRIAAPGAATGADLDGRCLKVAYAAGGSIYIANANGRGGVRRASAGGGAADPELSANGKVVVYERDGGIFVSHPGQSPRRIGSGTAPTADQWGRYVSFVSGGQLMQGNLEGAPRVRPVVDKVRGGQVNGTAPSMTAGGSWVFFVTGAEIDSNVYRRSASCPEGAQALEVMGSPHGNYAVFACSSGEAYLTYIGPR